MVVRRIVTIAENWRVFHFGQHVTIKGTPQIGVYPEKFNIGFLAQFFLGSSYTCMAVKKKLGQKVNVKFFTVDPYSVGAGVPRTFIEFGKIQKNIFWKLKRQQ